MTSASERALPAACEGAEVGAVSLTPINSNNSVQVRVIRRQSSVKLSPRLPLTPVHPRAALALLLQLELELELELLRV
jgi:hypothetical protein